MCLGAPIEVGVSNVSGSWGFSAAEEEMGMLSMKTAGESCITGDNINLRNCDISEGKKGAKSGMESAWL